MALARRSFGIASIFLALLTSNVAQADSLTDAIDPRSLALGEARRANASGTASTALNPSGLALDSKLAFDVSYGFVPDEDNTLIRAAACDSTVPVGGCFFYNYVSTPLILNAPISEQKVHEFGITSARAITPQILVGVNAKYVDSDGVQEESGFTSDLGLTLNIGTGVNLAAVGYNLLGNLDTPEYPRAFGTGVSLRPGLGALAINADGLWNTDTDDKKGRYSAGAEYRLGARNLTSYPLRIGGLIDRASENRYITGGVGFSTSKVALDVGVRSELSDGDDITVQIGLRLFAPAGN